MLTAKQLAYKVAEMRRMLIMVNDIPDRSIDFSHYIRRELPAVLDELERLQDIKANWRKGLNILDSAGVWTGADEDIADRIQAVLQGYLK